MKATYIQEAPRLRGRLANRAAESRSWRVALHLLCLLHHPEHLRWHYRGIARELFHAAPLFLLLLSVVEAEADAPAKEATRSGYKAAAVQQPVFATVIQPILLDRCSACHGPQKHRGNLRLDSFEALQRGGRNGSVAKPGQAKDSSLLKRMLLPLNEEGHMPPESSPQPAPEELAVLKWWVDAGMAIDRTPEELKPAPEIRRSLEVVSRRPDARN